MVLRLAWIESADLPVAIAVLSTPPAEPVSRVSCNPELGVGLGKLRTEIKGLGTKSRTEMGSVLRLYVPR